MVFVAVLALVVVPSCSFVVVQTIRVHHRASRVTQLKPGMTRAQVIALVGRPTSTSYDNSEWYYSGELPELLRFPFTEADEKFVEFSFDGHVTRTGRRID